MEGFIRPEASILDENAIIPENNLILPAPNQFTHELIGSQPFYYDRPQQRASPAGQFSAGTRVVLLVYEGGRYCRVVDGRGLYVEVEYGSLRKL